MWRVCNLIVHTLFYSQKYSPNEIFLSEKMKMENKSVILQHNAAKGSF